jgi:hypothetical protein
MFFDIESFLVSDLVSEGALIIVSAIQAKRPPPQASVILVGEGFQTLGSSELP